MSPHGGDESCIVSALAFGVVLPREFTPKCEYAPFVTKEREQLKPKVDCRVGIDRAHAKAIVGSRSSDDNPVLVQNLRNKAELVLIVAKFFDRACRR